MNFTDTSDSTAGVFGTGSGSKSNSSITVPCGKLTDYLGVLGIHHLTFLSVDVQGSELQVVQSIDWSALNVSVLAIEERRVESTKNRAVAAVLFKRVGMVRVLTVCNRFGRSCDSFFVNRQLVALHRLRSSIARFNFPKEHATGLRSDDDCGFGNQGHLFGALVGFETEATSCLREIDLLSQTNASNSNHGWQCVEKTAANKWQLGLNYIKNPVGRGPSRRLSRDLDIDAHSQLSPP